MLGIISGHRDYAAVRGVIEAIVAALNASAALEAEAADEPLLDPGAACRLRLGWRRCSATSARCGPRRSSEFDPPLDRPHGGRSEALAPGRGGQSGAAYVPLPPYPAVARDLNLVVDEAVRWADVAATVRQHGGPDLESLDYRQTYRDPQRLPPGKKSLLLTHLFALESKAR